MITKTTTTRAHTEICIVFDRSAATILLRVTLYYVELQTTNDNKSINNNNINTDDNKNNNNGTNRDMYRI